MTRHHMATYAVLLAVTLTLVAKGHTQTRYRVIYSFTGAGDGGGVWAGLALDQEGNLYGTTSGGGSHNLGTAWTLVRGPRGTWSQAVLHSFDGTDGGLPHGRLVLDRTGHAYGTTASGGANLEGTAFELANGSSGWTFSVLYNFCSLSGCADGGAPLAGMGLDKSGNLYGPGGSVVYQLSPGSGDWTESVLHTFGQVQGDGTGVDFDLLLDPAGNIYGTTTNGGNGLPICSGSGGCGIAFKLAPNGDGTWSERVLHSFAAFQNDGQTPDGGLVRDRAGNLYGVTAAGGGGSACPGHGCGTVYKLSQDKSGHWHETLLHAFVNPRYGASPSGNLIFDRGGNLYGTTAYGGQFCNCGVVYKLIPGASGKYTYRVLHNFNGQDGAGPLSGVIMDGQGNLYGTAVAGGPGGYGVVFEIKP